MLNIDGKFHHFAFAIVPASIAYLLLRCAGGTDSPTVSIWVSQPDFTLIPWLVSDGLAEFFRNAVNLIHIHINQSIRFCVACVPR